MGTAIFSHTEKVRAIAVSISNPTFLTSEINLTQNQNPESGD
ncbi:MAG: hypothetical protein V7L21_13230 [Nostoc sp.]|nr:hypothetical protein [Nostoc sp. NMS9]